MDPAVASFTKRYRSRWSRCGSVIRRSGIGRPRTNSRYLGGVWHATRPQDRIRVPPTLHLPKISLCDKQLLRP
jgi:hypothetical protein